MSLFIYPMVEGNLGKNTKNSFVARFTDTKANLTPTIMQEEGLQIGDNLFLTDSTGASSLNSIGAAYALVPYETGAGGAAWGSITGTLTAQTDLNSALGLKAPIASPTFAGTVNGDTVTQAAGDSTTKFASTAFVQDEILDLIKMRKSAGTVKINGRGGAKPTVAPLTVANSPQQLVYVGTAALDISEPPTTHFPLNNTAQSNSSVYNDATNSWLENIFNLGQTNIFRISISYTGAPSAQDAQIRFRLYNTNAASSFERLQTHTLDENKTDGQFDFDIITISDSLSLPSALAPDPGHGYNFEISSNRTIDSVILEDVTIISLPTSFA